MTLASPKINHNFPPAKTRQLSHPCWHLLSLHITKRIMKRLRLLFPDSRLHLGLFRNSRAPSREFDAITTACRWPLPGPMRFLSGITAATTPVRRDARQGHLPHLHQNNRARIANFDQHRTYTKNLENCHKPVRRDNSTSGQKPGGTGFPACAQNTLHFLLLVPKLQLGKAIFCRSSSFGDKPGGRESATPPSLNGGRAPPNLEL